MSSGSPTPRRRSITPTIVGVFYALATLICATAGVSLLEPSGAFAWIWSIKPTAYQQLLAMTPWTGIGFCLLAIAMALTALGCLRRKRWGLTLAVAIFAINGLADAARLFAGEVLEGLIGVLAVAAILYGLSRPSVRLAFNK